jgi:hypothetical protein
MIIVGIEPIPRRIPFKAGTRSDASAWGESNLPAADSLLVKVTTDQGLIGWGEAFGFRAVASAKLAIDQLIAPLCLGKDATRIEPLMLDVQRKLHVFGRGGALVFGMSAVDIALWDIAGKAANMPREAAPQISARMRAWSAIRIPPWSELAFDEQSMRGSARSSSMKSSLPRSTLPARRRSRHRVDARRQLPLVVGRGPAFRGRTQAGQAEMARGAPVAAGEFRWSR